MVLVDVAEKANSTRADGGRAPRLLKVVRLITGLEVGGAELGLLEILRHVDRTRFQCVVCCLYNNGSVGRQIENLGFPVRNMRMRSFCDPGGLLRLWRLLRAERPDILHTQLFRANLWGRLLGALLGVPVILSSEHSLTMQQIEGRRRTRLLSAIDRWTGRCCHAIVAVSAATQKCLIENGIPASNVEIIYNFVDTGRFSSEVTGVRIRDELGLRGAKVITIVARLHPIKNHRLLIKAFAGLQARHSAVKLLIVGEGALEESLRAQADAQAPGSVIFTGVRHDIPEIMAASDIVVLCSNNETFGRSLTEAMASGKPVIGTRVDGIPEVIVDGKTGLLVPPGNAPALTAAMLRLLDDGELAASMGNAGRKRACEHFDVRGATKAYEDLYLRLYSRYTIENPRSERVRLKQSSFKQCGALQVLCVCEPLSAGVPVYVEQVVRRLEGEQFHFTIGCPLGSMLRAKLADTSATMAEVDMHRGLNPLTEIHALFQLWRVMHNHRFDVVHLHSAKAGLLGRPLAALAELPIAFSPHCFSFESVRDHALLFRIYWLAERFLGRLTDCLVCVAATERDLALECQIARPERTVVIPCFADTALWIPGEPCAAVKSALGIPAANKVVGTISRFCPQKAPLDFARTAEALLKQRPDVTFLFIGDDGPLRLEFYEYLRAKNLIGKVIIQPWIDCAEELREMVSIFDVFALNSLWEGAPMAVIEAMSMAKPIAATDIPGTRAMLHQPECGLLSPVGHPELMAPNILQLLDSPELALHLGENGRRKAQAEFSLDRAEQQHKALYRKLASH